MDRFYSNYLHLFNLAVVRVSLRPGAQFRLPCQPSHAPDQYLGLLRVQSTTTRFRRTPAKRNLHSYELPFLFQVFCAIDVKEDRCGVVLITLSAKPLYKVPESGLLKPLVFCVS